MEDEKTLVREGGFILIGQLLERASRYIFIVIVTYLFSPSEYGLYVFSLSLVTLIYAISNMNIHKSISYFVPRSITDGRNEYSWGVVNKVLLYGGTIAVAVSITLFVSSDLISRVSGKPETEILFLLFSPLPILYFFRDVLGEMFNSIESPRYDAIMTSIVYPFLRIALLPVFLYSISSHFGLALIELTSWSVAILVGYLIIRQQNITLIQSQQGDITKEKILKYSLPLFGAGIAGTILSQIDKILLGILSESADPGLFNITVSVAILTTFVPQMFKQISKPIYSRMDSGGGETRLADFYIKTSRWSALLALPAAVFFISAHKEFVEVMFADEYISAASFVPLLVIGYTYNTFFGYHGQFIESVGETRIKLLSSVCMLGINTILDIMLIPEFGIQGAVIGTVTGIVVGTSIEIVFVSKYLGKIPITKYHLIYLGSSTFCLIIILIIKPYVYNYIYLFVSGIISSFLYVAIIWMLGGIQNEDWNIALSLYSEVNDWFN